MMARIIVISVLIASIVFVYDAFSFAQKNLEIKQKMKHIEKFERNYNQEFKKEFIDNPSDMFEWKYYYTDPESLTYYL